MTRKRRTRQHVIADLCLNHVEGQVLVSGHTFERVSSDYGIHLLLTTYDEEGRVQHGRVLLQPTATDQLRRIAEGEIINFAVGRRDLELWLREPNPVILVLYDAGRDITCWLYVQAYFGARPDFDLARIGQPVAVRIPVANVLDPSAVARFARYRDNILAQQGGMIRHHA